MTKQIEKKSEEKPKKILTVRASNELKRGVYANVVNIKANPDEFILDFILADEPKSGDLVSRVVISKQHAKRLADILNKLLKNS